MTPKERKIEEIRTNTNIPCFRDIKEFKNCAVCVFKKKCKL